MIHHSYFSFLSNLVDTSHIHVTNFQIIKLSCSNPQLIHSNKIREHYIKSSTTYYLAKNLIITKYQGFSTNLHFISLKFHNQQELYFIPYSINSLNNLWLFSWSIHKTYSFTNQAYINLSSPISNKIQINEPKVKEQQAYI